MRDYENTAKALRCCRLTSARGCAECPFSLNSNEKCANLLPDAADAIEELLAAVLKWISVEDEPPKENGRYLVRYKRDVNLGDEETVHEDEIRIMRFFVDDGWRYPIICNDHVRLVNEEVTHWMPLPAPPKEVLPNGDV